MLRRYALLDDDELAGRGRRLGAFRRAEAPGGRGIPAVDGLEGYRFGDVGFCRFRVETRRAGDRDGSFGADDGREADGRSAADRGLDDPVFWEPDLGDRVVRGGLEDLQWVFAGDLRHGGEADDEGGDAGEDEQGEAEGGEFAEHLFPLLADDDVDDRVDGRDDEGEHDDSTRADSGSQNAIHSFSPFRNEGGKFSIAPLTPERKLFI